MEGSLLMYDYSEMLIQVGIKEPVLEGFGSEL